MLEIELVKTKNVAMELFSMVMNRLRAMPDDENLRIYITPAALQNLLAFEPLERIDRKVEYHSKSFSDVVEHIRLFGYLNVWFKAPEDESEWPLHSILGLGMGSEEKTFFGEKTLEKVIIFELAA